MVASTFTTLIDDFVRHNFATDPQQLNHTIPSVLRITREMPSRNSKLDCTRKSMPVVDRKVIDPYLSRKTHDYPSGNPPASITSLKRRIPLATPAQSESFGTPVSSSPLLSAKSQERSFRPGCLRCHRRQLFRMFEKICRLIRPKVRGNAACLHPSNSVSSLTDF